MKGLIGPEILDLPRFIMNEADTKYSTRVEIHMREVLHRISETFGYSLEDVTKAYFMEVILGNIWCIEDGEEVDAEEVELATNLSLNFR